MRSGWRKEIGTGSGRRLILVIIRRGEQLMLMFIGIIRKNGERPIPVIRRPGERRPISPNIFIGIIRKLSVRKSGERPVVERPGINGFWRTVMEFHL
jgi:hypothetical protein